MARAAQRADLVAEEVSIDALSDPVTRYWHVVSPRRRALAEYRFLVYASGGNTGVWASVFRALGGFDERAIIGEDVEFSWRAQLAGHELVFSKEALVHERIHRDVGSMVAQHLAIRNEPGARRQRRRIARLFSSSDRTTAWRGGAM